jgi:hypothetical protein
MRSGSHQNTAWPQLLGTESVSARTKPAKAAAGRGSTSMSSGDQTSSRRARTAAAARDMSPPKRAETSCVATARSCAA